MNYVKKMCILRQIKQGFSGDGKTLSGLVKAEQYGKNLAVEVSIINFAPLVSGEYYCILSDGKTKSELLALRGKSIFNILTDMDISGGFCAVICFVKNEVVPIAYGINGNGAYDWKQILNATLPPSNSSPKPNEIHSAITQTAKETDEKGIEEQAETVYEDDKLAGENYYEEAKQQDEQGMLSKVSENAITENATKNEDEEERTDVAEDVDAARVLHPFKTNSDGYYLSVKSEMDELLKKYPRDNTLKGAFSCSEWVRIKGDETNPAYLVGVVYDDGKAKYICYALAAEDKTAPPDEIKDVCTFIPSTAYSEEKGFFVIFQSAATGECIKPHKI